MQASQSVLNYLFGAEELLQKAHNESTGNLQAQIYDVVSGINEICESLEDAQDPEDHPDWSVVPLTTPRYWAGSQSHQYERLYEHKGRKFKVRITRDAYDGPSSARIEGLDPQALKWNFIAGLPFSHWPTAAQGISYVTPLSVEQQEALGTIADELCEIVRKLMFVPE